MPRADVKDCWRGVQQSSERLRGYILNQRKVLGTAVDSRRSGWCHAAKLSEAGSEVGGRGPREMVYQNEATKVCIMHPVALMRNRLL